MVKLSLLLLGVFVAAAFAVPNAAKDGIHIAYSKDQKSSSTAIGTRITNGWEAERDQFPFTVSIRYDGSSEHQCGGVILASTVILTTAVCVDTPGSYSVAAGILELGENTLLTQVREVAEVVQHPNWPGGSSVSPYDIALLRLKTPLSWTQSVQLANIPKYGETYSGKAMITGWGELSEAGELATALRYAEVDILSQEECDSALVGLLGSSYPLDSTMICTSGAQLVSACSGDAGSPLVKDDTVVGVISWGITPCGVYEAPTVYTSVESYLDFIYSTTEDWI